MSTSESHLDGDLCTMEVCRGIGSRPDSGFSDIGARSTVGEASDTSLQNSLVQSSPIGFQSLVPRSPNQDALRSCRPPHRLTDLQPITSRGALPISTNRTFRPRSAPLAIDTFSLLEEDEEQDMEEADDESGGNNPQQSSNHRDHSPPPPVVFIPRDQRRVGAILTDMYRCLGRSSARRHASDMRSVATQTSIPLLAACPRPTPHRRLLAVRPQSAPLQEEEEGEAGEAVESVAEKEAAKPWRQHHRLPSPPAPSTSAVAPCCRFCVHSQRPQSSVNSPRSSSIFLFGEELRDLLDDCVASSSPFYTGPNRQSPARATAAEVADPSSDHEVMHEVSAFFESAQVERPTYVRLRSASAPIDDNPGEDAPRQSVRLIRRRLRRHSYNYENLVSIAQRMADAGDAFDLEHRLSNSSGASFFELGRSSSSLQWLSSSLADLVALPIGALRSLWTSGSVDGEE